MTFIKFFYLGYHYIKTIPKGSINIEIRNNNSLNYLALKHKNGSYYLNGGLEKLITGDTTYIDVIIYDLPNMLIGMMGGKLNNKLKSIYNQLINGNFENFA